MDKTVLEDYDALITEQNDLSERIARAEYQVRRLSHSVVADSVEGTREDGTYGPIKIKGVPVPAYTKELLKLEKKRTRYQILQLEISAMTEAIENDIFQVKDPQIRTILRLRYIDRKTWEQVGRSIRKSPDQCRMAVNRFFEKKT